MTLRRRSLALVLGSLAAPLALTAQPASDACAEQLALREKRLVFLQQRLANLEHELASRPAPAAASDAWRDPASWRALRNGMSQADVLRVLGPPGRVSAYYGFLRWEYPDALGTRVNFDERGRLIAWGAVAR
jgi:hypothetical protein